MVKGNRAPPTENTQYIISEHTAVSSALVCIRETLSSECHMTYHMTSVCHMTVCHMTCVGVTDWKG